MNRRSIILVVLAFVIGLVVMAGVGALLVSIQERKAEALQYPLKIVQISNTELDPSVWGKNFPNEYDTFMLSKDTSITTTFGGSVKYSKLERDPNLVRLWAGYAFAVDYNKARGHYYSLIDQKESKRTQVVSQPGACVNCHTAQAPGLIASMGWENFNHTPYNDMKDGLTSAISCPDCHDPQTMALRVTRPAFINAMKARGIDVTQASRQDMRTYVCAQCHVEYYFAGDNKVLTLPWDKGLSIDNIDAYYDQIAFKDWVDQDTGAPMIKIQHPDYETWSTSVHARSGVTCADCHMPYVREGAVKLSDHWVRSPLTDISQSCQPCHHESEEELKTRVVNAQQVTHDLTLQTESAIIDAINAIVAAKKAGATDADLAKAQQLHRKASMRWDFVSSENSTGFHSPQEAARILANAIDLARQAQLEAEHVSNAR